jgi:hypothetical protein
VGHLNCILTDLNKYIIPYIEYRWLSQMGKCVTCKQNVAHSKHTMDEILYMVDNMLSAADNFHIWVVDKCYLIRLNNIPVR